MTFDLRGLAIMRYINVLLTVTFGMRVQPDIVKVEFNGQSSWSQVEYCVVNLTLSGSSSTVSHMPKFMVT